MKANPKGYNHVDSARRINEILDQSDIEYEEVDNLPSRDRLTYTNGFYANCSAMYVDIRDSSSLAAKHQRPTLAKLYRAYVSEIIAVLNSDSSAVEINVEGDGVWAVYRTPLKTDIDDVFRLAATAHSIINVLNYELNRRNISTIGVGIGMSWGRALMVKAGFSGRGLDDVIYMGDVVNESAHLSAFGSKSWGDEALMVSDHFHGNLNDHNKGLLRWSQARSCWTGNVVNTTMQDWYDVNCK